ncbi:MAG: cellulase family glycosylhydrolase, partial [Pseudomonadota bacterium]
MSFRTEEYVATEADISAEELQTYGYFSTAGTEIVEDTTGEVIRLTGVNWHGAEGFTFVPGGLWTRNYRDMLDQIAETGYNLIRLPISPEVLRAPDSAGAVNLSLNPTFRGLTAIEMIDEIIDYAGQIGLRVLLDMHRRDPGVGKQQDGLWFSDDYSEDDLIADWQAIAGRYADDPTVVGADLFNEPSGQARWSTLDPRTPPPSDELAWVDAAERIANGIHEVNPDLLAFVEGVHIVDTKFYWVGGNLRGVLFDPVELETDNKLVYSPHDYPYSVRAVPWLEDATAEEMRANWDTNWGFLYDNGIAPVVIGETGSRFALPEDDLYTETLQQYLQDSANGGSGGIGAIWWTWGPNSFDTKGILEDDWLTVDQQKVDVLAPLFGPQLPVNERAARELNDVNIDVTVYADEAELWNRSYLYETLDLTAVAGEDYYAEEGVLQFSRSQIESSARLTLISDDDTEGRETFLFRFGTMDGAPLGLEKVTILDDDGTTQGDDGKVFVGAEQRSPGVWTIRLEAKDVDPTAENWKSLLYSDYFDLDLAVKGDISPVDGSPDVYEVQNQIKNGKFTNSLTATLKVPLEDMLGLETSLLFAEPFEEIDPDINPAFLSPTGKLFSGNPQVDISMEVVETFGTDFFARVTLQNNSDTEFENWELRLRGPFDVSNVGKVSILEQDEDWVFVQAPTWENDLAPGESFTFGISGTADLDPAAHIVA